MQGQFSKKDGGILYSLEYEDGQQKRKNSTLEKKSVVLINPFNFGEEKLGHPYPSH